MSAGKAFGLRPRPYRKGLGFGLRFWVDPRLRFWVDLNPQSGTRSRYAPVVHYFSVPQNLRTGFWTGYPTKEGLGPTLNV